MLFVDHIVNIVLSSVTYILRDGVCSDCWLVDCGDVDKIPDGLVVKGVLLTHAHCDHIYGINALLEKFPDAIVVTNGHGFYALQDARLNLSQYHDDIENFTLSDVDSVRLVKEGDVLELFDDVSVTVVETPGHDPSCISLLTDNYFFTGDSFIPGIKVMTGFPRSDKESARASLERIKSLSEGRRIMPGHVLD